MSTAPEREPQAARARPLRRSAVDGWALPLALLALVWLAIFTAWQAGRFRSWDERWARSDPEHVALSTRLALDSLRSGRCHTGLWIWRQVEVREPYAPEWVMGEAVACLEASGRLEQAQALVEAKCADAPSDPDALVPAFRGPPQYPQRARRKGEAGFVQVAFDVDAQGRVRELHVEKSAPQGVFDAAAEEAVGKWRYCAGVAREDVQVVLRFELD